MTFQEYAQSWLDKVPKVPKGMDTESDEACWACLKKLGMSKEASEAIMDPEFADNCESKNNLSSQDRSRSTTGLLVGLLLK